MTALCHRHWGKELDEGSFYIQPLPTKVATVRTGNKAERERERRWILDAEGHRRRAAAIQSRWD